MLLVYCLQLIITEEFTGVFVRGHFFALMLQIKFCYCLCNSDGAKVDDRLKVGTPGCLP